uniref:Uncharacterized protein n=1 Tax=Rhizophora mucronata TaxID=61149 RepID=A0A2P2Q1V7_RHIMU
MKKHIGMVRFGYLEYGDYIDSLNFAVKVGG